MSRADRAYKRGGLLPTPVFERDAARRGKAYPMLPRCCPYAALPVAGRARAPLLALAEDRPGQEALQIAYANPETGVHAANILGFYALMLRPGQALKLPLRSPAMVFQVIEGAGVQVEADAGSQTFELAQADTCCVPATRRSP